MGDFLGFCSSVVEVIWDVIFCHWVGGSMFWNNPVALPSKSQNSQEDLSGYFALLRTWWKEKSCLCQNVGLKSSSLEPITLLIAVPVNLDDVKQIRAGKV
jgi:hypothetical protein